MKRLRPRGQRAELPLSPGRHCDLTPLALRASIILISVQLGFGHSGSWRRRRPPPIFRSSESLLLSECAPLPVRCKASANFKPLKTREGNAVYSQNFAGSRQHIVSNVNISSAASTCRQRLSDAAWLKRRLLILSARIFDSKVELPAWRLRRMLQKPVPYFPPAQLRLFLSLGPRAFQQASGPPQEPATAQATRCSRRYS